MIILLKHMQQELAFIKDYLAKAFSPKPKKHLENGTDLSIVFQFIIDPDNQNFWA